ncbi:phage tail tape measure protein [Citrobacter braakii]|uniref:phage tail tape measure protein n=1 Tax=Citrobacter braakii TaxID=57706 RepID=UPI002B3E8B6C|nr:phage tail tape measure protein [Citrobacter braakii]MEB2724667.1 phage tail tape measure protein [Citrobacter braakii]HBL0732080.1 phage tail tape measure protein [Kluyvera ascorbata]
MARNLQLALSLLARDGASKVLKQAMQDIIKQTRATQKAGDEQAKSQQQNTSSAIRASRTLQDEYRRASSARSSLGIRSEREIQREIQQTQAAYNRLTRAGTMSANEQNRAFRAMTERVSKLRTELVGVSETMTRMQKIKAVGSTVAAVAGGVTAAAMVIKDPVQRQMAFEYRNAEIANTAYNNLPHEERKKKIPSINNAIREAVRKGGGTPEGAQETLNTLFAGGLDDNMALGVLPDITRYATASGADPQQLAKIAISALKNFNIKPEQITTLFDKAVRSGENGKYELADMASALPGIMTNAKAVGMSGLDDVDKLLAMLQANAETAGDNSQAATNVNNLFGKYTSADTQNALKNYRFKGKNGKALSYSDYMAEKRLQGVSVPDAFMDAVGGIVSSDKRVKKLRAEAEKYKGTDRENDILAALDVVVSSITSKIIADQQASMALKTNIMKNEFIKEQISGTRNATGAGDASFDVMSSTNYFKSQQLESEKMFAEQDSMKPVADLYGDLASKLADYSKEYPELTTAISGATTAIKAMSAAAIAFAGLSFLTGGGVKLPGGIKLPGGGAGGGGVLGRTWGAITKGGGPLSWRIAGPLAAAYAAYDLNNTYDDARDDAGNAGMNTGEFLVNKMKEREKNKKPLFDIDPGKAFSSWWSSPSTIGQVDPATTGVPSYLLPQQPKSQPFIITTKVMLDQREIAQSVNEFNGEQANRGSTGGPQ